MISAAAERGRWAAPGKPRPGQKRQGQAHEEAAGKASPNHGYKVYNHGYIYHISILIMRAGGKKKGKQGFLDPGSSLWALGSGLRAPGIKLHLSVLMAKNF